MLLALIRECFQALVEAPRDPLKEKTLERARGFQRPFRISGWPGEPRPCLHAEVFSVRAFARAVLLPPFHGLF